MTQPARHDIPVKKNEDYSLPIRIKDGLNQPLNLSGYTIAAQIWDETRTTKYADFTVVNEDLAAGRIKLTLSSANTRTLPADAWYDVLFIPPGGGATYFMEGIVYAKEGYTRVS